MTIKIILKSGVIIPVKCEKFTINRNGFECVTGYEAEGITENKPIYVNWDDISAIVRVMSDETDGAFDA